MKASVTSIWNERLLEAKERDLSLTFKANEFSQKHQEKLSTRFREFHVRIWTYTNSKLLKERGEIYQNLEHILEEGDNEHRFPEKFAFLDSIKIAKGARERLKQDFLQQHLALKRQLRQPSLHRALKDAFEEMNLAHTDALNEFQQAYHSLKMSLICPSIYKHFLLNESLISSLPPLICKTEATLLFRQAAINSRELEEPLVSIFKAYEADLCTSLEQFKENICSVYGTKYLELKDCFLFRRQDCLIKFIENCEKDIKWIRNCPILRISSTEFPLGISNKMISCQIAHAEPSLLHILHCYFESFHHADEVGIPHAKQVHKDLLKDRIEKDYGSKMFPKVQAYLRIFEQKNLLEQKIKSLVNTWRHVLHGLFNEFSCGWKKGREDIIISYMKYLQAQETLKFQAIRHHKVNEWKKLRTLEATQEHQRQSALKKEQKMEEEKRKYLEMMKRLENQRLIEEYQKDKERQNLDNQFILLQSTTDWEKEEESRRQVREERILYRMKKTVENEQKKKIAKHDEEEALKKQSERLEKLRESVRIVAEKDRARATGVTESWKLHIEATSQSDDEWAQFPFKQNTSFASEALEKDVRFQLLSKLEELGLTGHEYSGLVIKQLGKLDREQVSHIHFESLAEN